MIIHTLTHGRPHLSGGLNDGCDDQPSVRGWRLVSVWLALLLGSWLIVIGFVTVLRWITEALT